MFEVGSDAIHAYNLTAPFDLSTAAFANVTFPVLQDQTPTGMAFSNDGTKMFIVGFAKGFIHEYNLTAPFDISAVKHTRSLPVRSQDTQPQGMAFSNDGAKMFVVGDMEDAIHEYTLPTPFNVSAATHTYSFDVSGQDQTPTGMAFSNDGTKMFVVGDSEDKVHAYTLSSVYPIVSCRRPGAGYLGHTQRGLRAGHKNRRETRLCRTCRLEHSPGGRLAACPPGKVWWCPRPFRQTGGTTRYFQRLPSTPSTPPPSK